MDVALAGLDLRVGLFGGVRLVPSTNEEKKKYRREREGREGKGKEEAVPRKAHAQRASQRRSEAEMAGWSEPPVPRSPASIFVHSLVAKILSR